MTNRNEIGQWLEDHDLGQYAQVFADNGIRLDIISELTDADFKELGVNLGDRRRLTRAIENLRGTPAAELVAPAASERQPSGTVDRRQLTVMFCDMVGSTALSTELDAEDYRELLRDYQDACTNVIQEYGGFVAKYMGDGLDAYFGYPSGHENDAERAVLAGLKVIEAVKLLDRATTDASVAVRVGIATGPVVIGDIIGESASQQATVTGEMPNLAARLQEIAEANSVVVEPGTYRLVGPLFDWSDIGPRSLKGFPQHIHVRAVDGIRRTESRFEATHAGALPAFVGRQDELDILSRRWEQVREGEGQVVLLSGEAGIGKSRLAREFQEQITDTDHTMLQWQCSPFHTSSALYPLIAGIERIAGFTSRDTDEDKLRKLETWIGISGFSLEETLPLYASLLSVPIGDAYPPLELDPKQQRELLLDVQAERFKHLPSKKPVFFLIEDAHWIDPTSLELLERQIENVRHIATLLLITYRPEFEAPWIGRSHVTALTLNRLNSRNAAAMADAISGAKVLSCELRDQIVEKADGIPFFVEEMTKSVLESSLAEEKDGQVVFEDAFNERTIPLSLQDSLEARLDRLGRAKEIAQVGAAIGTEFPLKLVAEVLDMEESALEERGEPLAQSDLFTRRGSSTDTVYTFKHALVQEAAYGSLLRVAKQNIHRDIAVALENSFPESAETEPEILAHHYSEAGLIDPAIAWWRRAAARSVARSAHAEAVAQLQNALALVATLPDSSERDAQELDLLLELFGPFIALAGFGSPEIERSQVRALELCESLGEPEKMLPILHARYNFQQLIGRPAAALEYAEEYLRRAEAMGDDTSLMIGHRATGAAMWHVGHLVPALEHVNRGLELYRSELHKELVKQYGYDIKTTAYMVRTVLLGSLGYADCAAASLEEGLEHTRELNHPASLAFLIGHIGLTQHFVARDPLGARKCAEENLGFVEEFGASHWTAMSRFHLGRALFDEGKRKEGLELMQHGLGGPEAKIIRVAEPAHQVLLADALIQTDDVELALSYLDAAQEETDIGEDRWSEAEIWRVRGDALLKTERSDEAEASYRRAIEVARGQEAKTFEIRAATSLARVMRDHGRGNVARHLLAPVYAWFTEGFDTPDLKDAKTLLDELR
jgi:class 3 adenylate cyclase/tetratricopeptide (TPR) repeat protein